MQTEAVFSAVVESIQGDQLVLRLPKSNYQLHLAAPVDGLALQPGTHVHGVIRGQALRMHAAQGGGKFIEPIWGPPRIVAGTVLHVDEGNRTVIVDAAAIFHLTVPANQDFTILAPGSLVNFYIKSGARFELVE